MQINHPPAAGFLVQAVNVLGDQLMDVTRLFQLRQGGMGDIGLGLDKPLPTDKTAGPIALPDFVFSHEVLKLNRLPVFPIALPVTVIGNTRLGTAARTGQHKQAVVAV